MDGCALLARVLTAAIVTGDPGTALTPPADPTCSPALPAIAAGRWRGTSEDATSPTGYVVHTLEAALWAVGGATDFRDAILRAVNLGHDADTVAAVAGQIAGAPFGRNGLPAAWVDTLHAAHRIEALADDLLADAATVARSGG